DFIELSVGNLLMPLAPDAEFEAKTAKLGALVLPVRSCNGFFPANLKLVGPEVKMDDVLAFADTAFRRAKKFGIPFIVLGSGGARKSPDGFDLAKAREQFIDVAKRLGPLAAPQGVTVVLEPLNKGETNLINSVADGADYVDAIAHPNVQLLADIFHMTKENEGPDSMLKAGARLRHVHIAEKAERTSPGTAGDDFRPYFKALKAVGYKGGISVEGKWGKVLADDLPRALKTMKEQFASA
ncbi:MAG: sugar phosphate isomerase/epimerase, partial [Verrucomicrobia bacterium]|nr:sugar phosphate isomerase/epimerase [Verrucomicrobiota bacterium]